MAQPRPQKWSPTMSAFGQWQQSLQWPICGAELPYTKQQGRRSPSLLYSPQHRRAAVPLSHCLGNGTVGQLQFKACWSTAQLLSTVPSPCGTGCSARMAVLHAKGCLAVGQRFVGQSIIGSRFDCHIDSEVSVGGRAGIIRVISGSAWITGIHQHMLDPTDPFPTGYKVSDTWPAENINSR